jgi:hypothetical protein
MPSDRPHPGRKHYRFRLRSVVEFTRWDPKNNTFGFATDISVGGAFIETLFPAPLGSSICVRVWPPGWPAEMMLPGMVRWRSDAGMGVEFLHLGAREALGIHALVVEQKARQRAADA